MAVRSKRTRLAAALPARESLGPRIIAFMDKYFLTQAAYALLTWSSEQSVGDWIKGRTIPPGPAAALLTVLEQSEEARQILGVARYRSKNAVRKTKRTAARRSRTADKNAVPIETAQFFDPDLFVEGPVSMWEEPDKSS